MLLLAGCAQKSHKPHESKSSKPTLQVIDDFKLLETQIFNESDTTYVINFWATTCPPCIKEMPHFEALRKNLSDQKMAIKLVSIDEKKDLESRVKPFIIKHGLNADVILLGDENYSAWTEKIDKSWYGALPATLVIRRDKRSFTFGAFETYDDLLTVVNEVMY